MAFPHASHDGPQPSKKMTFDDLLMEAGGFGRFQVMMLLILCIPRLIMPLYFLQHIFISAVPFHHCAISSQRNLKNLSQEDLLLINSHRYLENLSQEDLFLINSQRNPENLSQEDLLLIKSHRYLENLSQEYLILINSQRNPENLSQEDLLLANSQRNPENLSQEDLLLINSQRYLENLSQKDLILINNQRNPRKLSQGDLILINSQRNPENMSEEDLIHINSQRNPENLSQEDLLLINSQRNPRKLSQGDLLFNGLQGNTRNVSQEGWFLLLNGWRKPVHLSQEDLLLINIPRESDGSFSSCKMFSKPQLHLIFNRSQELLNGTKVQSCDGGWEYDRSTFSSTTTTQWDLVCGRRGLSKLLVTVFFVGVMMGGVLFGYLSDRYGRRTMLLASLLLTLMFGSLSAGSVTYPMFLVFSALSGAAVSGLSITVIALSVEWVDARHRTDAAIVTSFCWSLGSAGLALLANQLRDWRWLMAASSAPCVIGAISIWWVPESARWLLAKGRAEEAETLLVRCAAANGRSLDVIKKNSENIRVLAAPGPSAENYSYVHLFRTRHLRRISACAGLVWFSVAFSYYGISLNIRGLGFDVYLTHFLYALIEVPGKLSVYFLMKHLGRRWTQLLTLFMTGACIGVAAGTPASLGALGTAVAIVGKGFSEAAFTALILYTAELYPTVIRQNGTGYTAFVGRLGASVAPLMLLLDDVWHLLPEMIFCAVAVACSMVAYLLPETLDVPLPESIQDVEQAGGDNQQENGAIPLTKLSPETSATTVTGLSPGTNNSATL